MHNASSSTWSKLSLSNCADLPKTNGVNEETACLLIHLVRLSLSVPHISKHCVEVDARCILIYLVLGPCGSGCNLSPLPHGLLHRLFWQVHTVVENISFFYCRLYKGPLNSSEEPSQRKDPPSKSQMQVWSLWMHF